MTNKEIIKWLQSLKSEMGKQSNRHLWNYEEALDMAIKALAKDGWIPVKWHEITDEEREREGYPKDWAVLMDCDMPSDEQEILVTTTRGIVEKDVCYLDGEFSLDSGWDWVDDVTAWMPLPEPYREEDAK